MPIISQGVPAFASGNASAASAANDANPASGWVSDQMPGWIAYDLSSVPANLRHRGMAAWYSPHQGLYIDASLADSNQTPIDYVIETNAAPSGSTAPSTGWVTQATVTGNDLSSRQHLISLEGANWVRMRITKTTSLTGHVEIDLDIYSAPAGASDSWLFMGDSITYMGMQRAFSDLPNLAHQIYPQGWPAIIDAAIGGTNTGTASAIESNGKSVIENTMAASPGRYVVLAYGTNDHPSGFQMENLVQKVLAAGKVPVIPHMPWSDQRLTEGPLINQQIDALYAKYPQIIPGPDLWTAFLNRPDLIQTGDVHPNSAGREILRQQWATKIAAWELISARNSIRGTN